MVKKTNSFEIDFESYIRESEPDKKGKSIAWSIATGLQQVDGLTPSPYLYETAKRNIEGEISIEEAKKLIDSYYESKTSFYNNEKVLLSKSAGYITFDKNQNIHFLRYYLQSYSAKKIEEFSLLGSTIQNLSLYTLNNFSVPIPPKEDQKNISDYLDKKCNDIDSAIEQKQKLIEKLTEYKKSLIYECVTGKKEIKK